MTLAAQMFNESVVAIEDFVGAAVDGSVGAEAVDSDLGGPARAVSLQAPPNKVLQ